MDVKIAETLSKTILGCLCAHFSGGDLTKNWLFIYFQEKFEWIEEPVDKSIKQGTIDEISFACKLSHKGKKAKWYLRNQVRYQKSLLIYNT